MTRWNKFSHVFTLKRAVVATFIVTIGLGLLTYMLLNVMGQSYTSGARFEPHSVHFSRYPFILWLGVISNVLAGLAFLSIPIAISYFLYKREDIQFNWIFFLFSSFIFWCGLHHLVHVTTYWVPLYAIQASVDFITGGISLMTASILWYIMPKALKLPKVQDIISANRELEKRVIERTKTLYEREKQYRDLADSMPQLIWTALPDGTVDYYNEKFKQFEGITKSNEGFNWEPVIHPEDTEKTLQAWTHALKTGRTYEVEHRIKLKDDGYRWLLSRGVPVKDKKGRVIKWYGTATDIDQNKKMERQKDEFLSVASHELKTPVTSIKAYTQVLMRQFEKKGEVQAVQFLGKMDNQIDRLTSLITDLLDVTKIESGKMQFRKEYFDFNKLVEEIAEEVQHTTTSHKIILQLKNSNVIYGDRDRIGQVLTNLLTNAIKYSPQAKKIIVKTWDENDNMNLTVIDYGIGIPPEKQRNLFTRFYRVEGQSESTFPGLGLGLYISSEIIKRQNGKIWVQSQPGKGSSFHFQLPIANVKKQQNGGHLYTKQA